MTPKLTKARRTCVRFFTDNGPIALWPIGLFSSATRRRCEAEGLIETAGRESGVFGLTKFVATDKGRRALEES